MPLPTLTDEQRKAALAAAAEARRQRAEIKAKLKNGSLGLAEVLQSDNLTVRKTKILAVLEALPGVGKVRATKAMEDLNIAASRSIRGLGDKQKQSLLERFGK